MIVTTVERLKLTNPIKGAFGFFNMVGIPLIITAGFLFEKVIFIPLLVFFLIFEGIWAVFIINLDRDVKNGKITANSHKLKYSKIFSACLVLILISTSLLINNRR